LIHFTLWVTALHTRLSCWRRAWGRCSSLRAVARYVVTLAGRNQARGLASLCRSIVRRHNGSCGTLPTQPRRQQPTRVRPTEESSSLSDFRHRSVLEERRSQIQPQRRQFLPNLQPHSRSYGAKKAVKNGSLRSDCSRCTESSTGC